MTTTVPRATAPVPLHIVVSCPSPGTARLTVAGDVDLATAAVLGLRLLSMMHADHPAVVVVDLTKVTFLDCAGIGVLIAVRNTAERIGCQFRISHPQPMIAHILDVVGLLGLFTAPIVPVEPQPPSPVSVLVPRTRVVRLARAMVGRLAA
jgi:anti-anti-sigma factor